MALTWWSPGSGEGLVSRTWAQIYVFPMPRLRAMELDQAIRYKVQAMLPSPEVSISTQSFQHRGEFFGLALVDRFPDPRPDTKVLRVGHPVILPKSWPADCLVAVNTPDGWEVHCFEQGVLALSYPPSAASSNLFAKIQAQHDGKALLAVDPGALGGPHPKGAIAAPNWPPGLAWGVGWNPPPRRHVRLIAGALMGIAGVIFWALAAKQVIDSRLQQVEEWKTWVKSAQVQLSGTATTQRASKDLLQLAGFDMDEILGELATSWPSGVKVTRLEIRGERISLTAHAPSALVAVSKLQGSALLSRLKVTQIQPRPGTEEFALEGKLEP